MRDLGVLDPDLYANGDPWRSGLPLDLFSELRDERPCYWQSLKAAPLFVNGVWVVSRYADVVAVICDTRRFSNRAGISVRRFDPTRAKCGGKPTMMSMDGNQHRDNRTVTHRLFSRRAVHDRRLFKLGIHRGEMFWLGALARYLGLVNVFTGPPLRLAGVVGYPATAVALV
jgi:cytochrome P450